MSVLRLKSLLVALFSAYIVFSPNVCPAQHEAGGEHLEPAAADHGKKEGFDANEVIFSHIMDAHEYHFLDITDKDGVKKPIGIPLPVIL